MYTHKQGAQDFPSTCMIVTDSPQVFAQAPRSNDHHLVLLDTTQWFLSRCRLVSSLSLRSRAPLAPMNGRTKPVVTASNRLFNWPDRQRQRQWQHLTYSTADTTKSKNLPPVVCSIAPSIVPFLPMCNVLSSREAEAPKRKHQRNPRLTFLRSG